MNSMSESAIRRRAKKRGLKLEKSRNRRKDSPAYGKFVLINVSTNMLILGGTHDDGASLEECARYIDRQPIQD